MNAIEQMSLSGVFPAEMTVDTIVEIAKFADMHIWPRMEKDLIEYIENNQQKICKEISGMYDETTEYKLIEIVDIFLTQFLVNIPGAIKRPFVEIGIRDIARDDISIKNNSLFFTLADLHFQKMHLNFNFESNFLTFVLPLDFLDFKGIAYFQDLPPLESINKLYLKKTETEFPSEFLIYKFTQIALFFQKLNILI